MEQSHALGINCDLGEPTEIIQHLPVTYICTALHKGLGMYWVLYIPFVALYSVSCTYILNYNQYMLKYKTICVVFPSIAYLQRYRDLEFWAQLVYTFVKILGTPGWIHIKALPFNILALFT